MREHLRMRVKSDHSCTERQQRSSVTFLYRKLKCRRGVAPWSTCWRGIVKVLRSTCILLRGKTGLSGSPADRRLFSLLKNTICHNESIYWTVNMQLHHILLDLCVSFTFWGWGSHGVIISMNEHQAPDNDWNVIMFAPQMKRKGNISKGRQGGTALTARTPRSFPVYQS